MKKLLLLSLIIILSACNASKQIEKQLSYGNYDKAINDALRKLSSNKERKSKQEYIGLLKRAYNKAADRDLNDIDYQFSEIAQIIESNDSKILAFYNDSIDGSNQIKLTIKITQTNLGAVLQTFSRYDYTIDEIFSDEEIANQTKDRYDHLINYLEV